MDFAQIPDLFFFLDIPHLLGTCIIFGICISEIQSPIYLHALAVLFRHSAHPGNMCYMCTSRWCIYFRHFRHLAPNLFAHFADAPGSSGFSWTFIFYFSHLAAKLLVHALEILHFSGTIYMDTRVIFISDIPHISGKCTTFLHDILGFPLIIHQSFHMFTQWFGPSINPSLIWSKW